MRYIKEIAVGSRGTIVKVLDCPIVDESEKYYIIESNSILKLIRKDLVLREDSPIDPRTRVYYVLYEKDSLASIKLEETIKEAQEFKDKLLEMKEQIEKRIIQLDECIEDSKKSLQVLRGGIKDVGHSKRDTQKIT